MYINHVAYKFWEFIVVTNRNNNTLENHEQITLNKDDGIYRRFTNSSYVAMYFHYNTTC